jgi:hypothetical protein
MIIFLIIIVVVLLFAGKNAPSVCNPAGGNLPLTCPKLLSSALTNALAPVLQTGTVSPTAPKTTCKAPSGGGSGGGGLGGLGGASGSSGGVTAKPAASGNCPGFTAQGPSQACAGGYGLPCCGCPNPLILSGNKANLPNLTPLPSLPGISGNCCTENCGCYCACTGGTIGICCFCCC